MDLTAVVERLYIFNMQMNRWAKLIAVVGVMNVISESLPNAKSKREKAKEKLRTPINSNTCFICWLANINDNMRNTHRALSHVRIEMAIVIKCGQIHSFCNSWHGNTLIWHIFFCKRKHIFVIVVTLLYSKIKLAWPKTSTLSRIYQVMVLKMKWDHSKLPYRRF